MPDKVKLTDGPEKTVTWIWSDDKDQLKIEVYDFSALAQSIFGNDVVYTIIHDTDKLLSGTKQDQTSII